jgi:xanthine dehydrogenase accessory factor
VTRTDTARREAALAAERVPYVSAQVVRAQRPSSVRAGDSALILGDGTIEGFVGGACAESSVRLQALRVLETGEPVVLRILPGDGEAPAQEGAVTVQNPCLSGGALEIFLEPRLPAPRLAVVGDTPVAQALVSLGERLGYEPVGAADAAGSMAVVVASHGRDEEEALAASLQSGVPYVGLVASRRRGAAVVEALRAAGVEEHDLERLRTPAGLDIGAQTADEIALSILAELVSVRNARSTVPASAIDPVCGMEVVASSPSPSAEHDGRTVWFCGEGCRSAFEADAERYVAAG